MYVIITSTGSLEANFLGCWSLECRAWTSCSGTENHGNHWEFPPFYPKRMMSWMMVHGIIFLSCVGLLWRDYLLSRNIYIISLWLNYYVGEWAKKPIKTDGWNHHTQNKREGQKKGQKMRSLQEPQMGES
jgi:hypothetical protein